MSLLDQATEQEWNNIKHYTTKTVGDSVHSPKHYQLFPNTEVIDVMKMVLSSTEYIGYLKGNILKYKLRAGEKDNALQDLAKAKKYQEFLEEFIHG